jgi:hypothetical protein
MLKRIYVTFAVIITGTVVGLTGFLSGLYSGLAGIALAVGLAVGLFAPAPHDNAGSAAAVIVTFVFALIMAMVSSGNPSVSSQAESFWWFYTTLLTIFLPFLGYATAVWIRRGSVK